MACKPWLKLKLHQHNLICPARSHMHTSRGCPVLGLSDNEQGERSKLCMRNGVDPRPVGPHHSDECLIPCDAWALTGMRLC